MPLLSTLSVLANYKGSWYSPIVEDLECLKVHAKKLEYFDLTLFLSPDFQAFLQSGALKSSVTKQVKKPCTNTTLPNPPFIARILFLRKLFLIAKANTTLKYAILPVLSPAI